MSQCIMTYWEIRNIIKVIQLITQNFAGLVSWPSWDIQKFIGTVSSNFV